MRDYPKGQLSRVDFENLLSMSEHSSRAKADLEKLAAIDDSKIIIEEGTAEVPKLRQIDNPNPSWKRIGFKNKKELSDLSKAEIKPIDDEKIESGDKTI